ncbi:MAG TPA: ATP-dependent protease LonB, partial [Thermoplasmata archaeon]|nr:ATP-dependent protease LonB [Thermoplasmata archaeon]
KQKKTFLLTMVVFTLVIVSIFGAIVYGDMMYIFYGIIAAAFIMIASRMYVQQRSDINVPKLLVSFDTKKGNAPFEDATGAHAGALLGDVRHDPFQSGGLETPAHERVEPGAIHKANKGVLFIDEINTLRIESQQNLLTALQEKQFPIMGQSERSSGAMVKTEPVPCDFILVAAGNVDALRGMHPALRSRIRGYGYEVYLRSTMEDTIQNREKLVRFIAQEVIKDGKIPHFDKGAVLEVLREAQRRAGRRGKLTLRLRELGGLVRVAGDIAREEKSPIVTREHVLAAKSVAKSLEQQIADKYIEKRKEYQNFLTKGTAVGLVNGLAVLGADTGMNEQSGIIMPIAAEVTAPQSREEGRIIATGKLGEIAKEAVQNVSAVIKKYTGRDISNYDVHVQFVGSYEGVEGDSASISVATAVISAMENIPVNQEIAMTGSLNVRGDVLPVGGVTAKIEAAAEAGLKKVIIPKTNMRDVLIETKYKEMVKIYPVETIRDVLEIALVGGKKQALLNKFSAIISSRFPPKSKKERPMPKPTVVVNKKREIPAAVQSQDQERQKPKSPSPSVPVISKKKDVPPV